MSDFVFGDSTKRAKDYAGIFGVVIRSYQQGQVAGIVYSTEAPSKLFLIPMDFFNPPIESLNGLSKNQVAKRTTNFSAMTSVQFEAGEDNIITWILHASPTQMLEIFEGKIAFKTVAIISNEDKPQIWTQFPLPENAYNMELAKDVIPNVPLVCYVEVDVRLDMPNINKVEERDFELNSFYPTIQYSIIAFVSVDVTNFKLVKEMIWNQTLINLEHFDNERIYEDEDQLYGPKNIVEVPTDFPDIISNVTCIALDRDMFYCAEFPDKKLFLPMHNSYEKIYRELKPGSVVIADFYFDEWNNAHLITQLNYHQNIKELQTHRKLTSKGWVDQFAIRVESEIKGKCYYNSLIGPMDDPKRLLEQYNLDSEPVDVWVEFNIETYNDYRFSIIRIF